MGPWMWGINPDEFSAAQQAAEQAAIDAEKPPHPSACHCGSPEAPPPIYGAKGTPWHYHLECWNCGTEMVTRSPVSYRCRCGVEQSGPASVTACPTFDQKMATERSHP